MSLAPLKKLVSKFPKLPGVYLMRDAAGQIIYIGKAKDLRARVRSYFSSRGDGRVQIEFLMRRVTEIDKIVTEGEGQAVVLERDLINKHKPRYNIRLKDDKEYLSIRLDDNKEWPRLELVRRVPQDGARYYGPYTNSYELRQLLEIIKRTVPLRTCSDTVFYNRARPCLEYQIKHCAGPCCLAVDPDSYRDWVKQARSILEGRVQPVITELENEMAGAARDLNYEHAATVRDRIEVLKGVKQGYTYVSVGGESRDVFALYREEGLVSLSILQVRSGRITDTANFTLSNVELSDQAVVESAIEQFYLLNREIPEEIVVPVAIAKDSMVSEQLQERRGEKITIAVPKRGIRFRLLNLARVNAREQFVAHFDAESRYSEISNALARMFKLKQIPRRIECVDISNLQGSDIVGAVVSFFDGVPDKNSYRRYRISFEKQPNDFAAIHEVVSRRLAKGAEDAPDLLIIDGGAGQLKEALRAREEAKLALEIISIAKMKSIKDPRSSKVERKPERIFLEGANEPIALDESLEVTKFIKRIRDETHRFVISYHRARRARRVMMSKLDMIPGVGVERKRRLLKRFGGLRQIAAVSPAELSKVGRMPLAVAERISLELRSRRKGR